MKADYVVPALEESSRLQPRFNTRGSSGGPDYGLLTGRGESHLLCSGVSQQTLGGAQLEWRVLQAGRRACPAERMACAKPHKGACNIWE